MPRNEMLWYKAWLETRWRFLIGLALLLCSAAATVLTYPAIVKLIPPAATTNASGVVEERIREAIELSRTYRGYMWSHWFGQNLKQWATLFAILLGTAGVLSPSAGALFTLSLPVTRKRLLGVRAATALAELFVIVFVPSLLVSLLSPSIAQSFAPGATLVYSACFFVGVSVFFSLAFLLSTVFDDLWRPLLIAIAVAFVLSMLGQVLTNAPADVYRVMSAETYFRSGRVPWIGLIVTAAISAAMLYAAAVNVTRRDF
jgi:ABC-2 type transport system permease protein